MSAKPLSGGPATCPKPCTECPDRQHHFIDSVFSTDEPEHEAAKLGVELWYTCKHCDAWIEILEEDDYDYGPEDDDEPDEDYQEPDEDEGAS